MNAQDEENDIGLRLLRAGPEPVRPGATPIGQANSTTHRDVLYVFAK